MGRKSTRTLELGIKVGQPPADGLKNLSDLHQQGILTNEEFTAVKRRLLEL